MMAAPVKGHDNPHSGEGLVYIPQISLFQGLPPAAQARLAGGATVLEPRSKATLFVDGDDSDAVYAIVSGEGHVRIGVINQHSKGMMVAIYRKGELFGEIGAIDGQPRSASAVVDGRVRLLRIRRALFLAVLNDTPALGAALSHCLAQRLRRTSTLLQDATFETLEIRLARQIIYLARVDGRSTELGRVIGARMNQGDMADLLGTTNRSIIAILNRWRLTGIVHFDPAAARLTIMDEMRLAALSATPEHKPD